MFKIHQDTLVVTKIETGESFDLFGVDDTPLRREFIAWRKEGNAPEVEVEPLVHYILESYVPREILISKPLEHVNFKTETDTPLHEVEVRNNGWLHNLLYYGYNQDNGQYDQLAVKMEFLWTHDALGFAKTRQKKMYLYLETGDEVLKKTFPPEDVSQDSMRIGKERREYLIDKLILSSLGYVIYAVNALDDIQKTALGLDLGILLTANNNGYILENVARPFISSMGDVIRDYIDNHTLGDIRAHISARSEVWLDITIPTEGKTLRTFMSDSLS